MNIDKTKFQLFPIGRHVDVDLLANRYKILIGKEPLQHVQLYKYLGVEIDRQPTHHETTCQKYNQSRSTQIIYDETHSKSFNHTCCSTCL